MTAGLGTFDRTGHATERANIVIDPWFLRRLIAGWKPEAVAVACGVSLRTAYRWRQKILRIDVLRVDGWEADFAIRRDGPPTRVSLWRRNDV